MTDPSGQGGRKGAGPRSDPNQTPPDTRVLQEKLEELRGRILEVDQALVALVGERRGLVLEVGRLKAQLGLPVLDPSREATVVRRVASLARDQGVDEELMRDVVWRIIAAARDEQEGSA